VRLSIPGRTRSARIFLAQAEDNDDAEDEDSSNDESPPAPPNIPRHRNQGAAQERNPPSEAELHMEDWEVGDGRAGSAGERMFHPTSPFASSLISLC
jgi:hypothetical protein